LNIQDVYGSSTELSIKTVSTLTGISQTTLRSWETHFNIPVGRNTAGQRIYSENTINIFKQIKKLSKEGLHLEEIKPLLNMDLQTYGRPTEDRPKIEIIQDTPEEKKNYELILKPYTDRIKQLEVIENKYISMVQETATLTERVKNKDDIISFKDNQINELKERLIKLENRKFWQFWK
jgi:DNA-binding transcriptional MerR regulator